jgi:hypothetical protein
MIPLSSKMQSKRNNLNFSLIKSLFQTLQEDKKPLLPTLKKTLINRKIWQHLILKEVRKPKS